ARAAIAACVAALYSAMCGFAPSVLRAAWMGGAALLADAAGRPSSGRRALWLSALVLIAWSPALACDLGFQFSFLATWGLLSMSPLLADRLRSWLGVPHEAAMPAGIFRSPGDLIRGNKRARAFGVMVRWRFVFMSLAIDLAVTPLAPLIWCTPLQLLHFAKLSAWSLPANWLADGIVIYLTYAGFAITAAGMIWSPLAFPGPWLLGVPLAILDFALRLLHGLPGAVITLPPPPTWSVAWAYVALCAWQALRMPALRQALPFSAGLRAGSFLSAFAALAIGAHAAAAPSGRLEVVFLDVGQGDAILVRGPRGSCAIVDAGPGGQDRGVTSGAGNGAASGAASGAANGAVGGAAIGEVTVAMTATMSGWNSGSAIVVPAMRHMGCRKLDLVALTHPHGDHMGGMAGILGKVPVHEVWDAGQSMDSKPYGAFLMGVLAADLPLVVPGPAHSRLLDGVRWSVLAPSHPQFSGTRSDCNNDSLVIGLEWGVTRILLAGDLESEGEHRLLRSAPAAALRADVLKVPHHGSRFGSTPEFLVAVRPRASVVSAGRQNAFGHPAPAVLARLADYGPIYRTDRHGAVALLASASTWSIQPFF
ncbi:MAG: ComEC/Rec2 family competence protein, partial [Candidatus Sericytochromatia bacterium]|nr:ComEC/Rec2 family competence protein [Candidatus Tanganyikabacteria bacterium]